MVTASSHEQHQKDGKAIVFFCQRWCSRESYFLTYLQWWLVKVGHCEARSAEKEESLHSGSCLTRVINMTSIYKCKIFSNDIHSRGERIVFWWPNTNTNIIRLSKTDRIRIRILFGLPKMTEYEYEYYSVSQKWPNTNTNIIRLHKNDWIQIQILFGFPKMNEYEYYSTL